MNTFSAILEPGAVRQLGWTLVHFVWQGALLALVFAVLQIVLRGRSANARYLGGCCVLFFMLTAPVATFSLLARNESSARQTQIEAAAGPAAAPVSANANAPTQPVVITSSRTRWEGLGNWGANPLEASLPWLVAFWLAGVLLLSLRLVMGSWQVYRFKHARNEPLGESYLRQLGQLKTALAVNRPVRLVKSALVEVPTVIGWLTPVILLPASTLIGLSPNQLEAILAHELAHIRSHDYLVNLLQKIAETLLFYHPAVWWVSHRVRVEREHCCDDLAVDVCGNRALYAQALATLEELRGAPIPLAMAAKDGPLLARIRRLSGFSSPASWYKAEGALPVVLGILVALFCCDRLGAFDLTEKPHNPKKPEISPSKTLEFEKSVNTSNSALPPARLTSASPLKVMYERLNLVIDSVSFKAAPLSQVVSLVNDKVKAADKEGRGIEIALVERQEPPSSAIPTSKPHPRLGDTTITIDPPLKQATLSQVLEAILKGASQPLLYSVENSRILFSFQDHANAPLFARWFKMETNEASRIFHLTFRPTAPSQNDHEQWSDQIRRFLETQGIPRSAPRQVAYDAAQNAFLVRASLAVEQLLSTAPLAVRIEVKIAEITLQGNQATHPNLWLDAGLKEEGTEPFKTLTPTNYPQGFYRGIMQYHGRGDGTLVTNLLPATNYALVSGRLADAQFREVMSALDRRAGVDVLSTPNITTKSEQQAQIKIADIRAVVTSMTVQTNAGTGSLGQSKNPEFQPVTEQFETGVSVDVVPTVSPDRQSIRMTLIGSVNEFLDYATPAQNDTLTAVVNGKKISTRKPLPQFRLRRVVDGVNMPLGQTAVLGIGPITEERKFKDKVPVLGDIPLLGSLFRNEGRQTMKKNLWFFITPNLVDAKGRLLRQDAEPEGK